MLKRSLSSVGLVCGQAQNRRSMRMRIGLCTRKMAQTLRSQFSLTRILLGFWRQGILEDRTSESNVSHQVSVDYTGGMNVFESTLDGIRGDERGESGD